MPSSSRRHRGAVDLHRLGPGLATLVLALLGFAIGAGAVVIAPLFLLVAAYVAATLHDRGAVIAQVGLATVGLLATVAPAHPAESLAGAAVTGLLAVVITRAREKWEARHEQLRDQARADPVTGVANFRALGERLHYEIVRHRRHGRPFAVLMLDLDLFKEVNERYGHLEGDRLLEAVAAAMSGAARDQDTVARQGGDEFCLLAPETDREGARVLAARVADAIARSPNVRRRVTASVGWAVFPEDGTSARDLLLRADLSLMQRKEHARGARAAPQVAIARSA
jgi:diguanylate cyclase (GGDEF)-like protein